MRDPFNRFALRYLAAVVCGLALLLLHSTAQSGLPAAFVPQCPSPWELSKLAFWPLLAAWVLTGRLGRERRTLLQDLPAAVLTPLAMTAACWGLAAAGETARRAWRSGRCCWRRARPSARTEESTRGCGQPWLCFWRGCTCC